MNELTVVTLKIKPGDPVKKGQRLADLESDKSIFEFESPCEGTIRAIHVNPGDVKEAGGPFLQIETADDSLRHLESKGGLAPHPTPAPVAAFTACSRPELSPIRTRPVGKALVVWITGEENPVWPDVA